MGEVTHEQANLLLRLYEIRREPRLREARAWLTSKFDAKTPEEMAKLCPPGSEEHASFRMAVSYWEMATGLANRGLIEQDLFCENAGEAWFIWDRIRYIVPSLRAAYKNPATFHQLETFAKRFEVWRERQAHGASKHDPVAVPTAAE